MAMDEDTERRWVRVSGTREVSDKGFVRLHDSSWQQFPFLLFISLPVFHVAFICLHITHIHCHTRSHLTNYSTCSRSDL